MCVLAQLPKELGGAEGKACMIDTEGTFRPERISQIAERWNIDTEAALENILYARALNSEHQLELLNICAREFASGEYKLLVIDSIMNCFRVDYCGRGELSERQQKLNQFLMKLAHMAEEFNICVLMVSHVTPSWVMLGSQETFRSLNQCMANRPACADKPSPKRPWSQRPLCGSRWPQARRRSHSGTCIRHSCPTAQGPW